MFANAALPIAIELKPLAWIFPFGACSQGLPCVPIAIALPPLTIGSCCIPGPSPIAIELGPLVRIPVPIKIALLLSVATLSPIAITLFASGTILSFVLIYKELLNGRARIVKGVLFESSPSAI